MEQLKIENIKLKYENQKLKELLLSISKCAEVIYNLLNSQKNLRIK